MSTLDPTLAHILDLARWAPSGDNTQPWRFEIVDARHLVVHGFDTRDHCVYDLDGHPSQISLGALLETMACAASLFRLSMQARRRPGLPDNQPTFDVAFTSRPGAEPDPLALAIEHRSVQRRPLSTRALTPVERQALQAALPAGYRVLWLDSWAQRWAMARLLYRNAGLRLTMPEAHQVHRAVIEWKARYSNDRIPEQALGVDPLTARVMQWVMQSWDRVAFFNTWLAGTVAPRLQMDLLPALACAAHFVLVAETAPRPQSTDDYVAAGRAMQRFWLAAAHAGLQLQPELTPLIFARYVRESRPFSRAPGMQARARALAEQAQRVIGQHEFDHAVFMGRIGAGAAPRSRSLRLPLDTLIVPAAPARE
ncbi:nitroreductase family protein [Duganella sp. FT3S]|uniref:Nitroreductase family protein n=1 Tax=Rugamonas fusca TaxID=2758568 RepID=A0A7W2EI13_9BURK|nr:nitroreductase family protein [Rugamonas fusca]MBA5606315.1 nitroreductase family protein [Rugamonas fusca]